MKSLLSALDMRGFEITDSTGFKHYINKFVVIRICRLETGEAQVHFTQGNNYTWITTQETYEQIKEAFEQ
jgi:hypothetical protein